MMAVMESERRGGGRCGLKGGDEVEGSGGGRFGGRGGRHIGKPNLVLNTKIF